MAIQQPPRVGVTADLRVLVPRDAAGDLADGVETVVRRVESVAAVEDVDVTGVTPRLNDLAVEARVEVRVTVDAEDAESVGVESDGSVEADGGVERPAEERPVVDRPAGEAVAAALDEGFGVEVSGVAVE